MSRVGHAGVPWSQIAAGAGESLAVLSGGLRHLQDCRYRLASRALRAVVASGGGPPNRRAELFRELGRALFACHARAWRRADLEGSAEAYRRALRFLQNLTTPDVLVEAATVHEVAGSHASAAQIFGRVIEMYPRSSSLPMTVLRAAASLTALNQYAQAIAYVSYVMAAPPAPFNEDVLTLVLARLYLKNVSEDARVGYAVGACV